jgi:hypothetical protein
MKVEKEIKVHQVQKDTPDSEGLKDPMAKG